jgi:hypothetical protein
MNQYDEDRSVFTGHYEVDVLIDRLVGQVWKQLLDISSWVTSHEIELVSGAPDAVGGITRVSAPSKIAREITLPPPLYHYCKIIELVPEQRYLLKTYSEKGGSYGMHISGFDDVRLVSIEKKTKVIVNLFCEFRGDVVAKDPAAMSLDVSRDGMRNNLDNLKRILESR